MQFFYNFWFTDILIFYVRSLESNYVGEKKTVWNTKKEIWDFIYSRGVLVHII